jgi:hypothetical protein
LDVSDLVAAQVRDEEAQVLKLFFFSHGRYERLRGLPFCNLSSNLVGMEAREYQIREALRKGPVAQIVRNERDLALDELGICEGSSRIDMAVVNGSFWGFEIKSERDTLTRLPRQIEYYGRVFDRLYLVTSDEHISDAEEFIPEYWGVLEVVKRENEVAFQCLRKPEQNPEREAFAIAQLLWKWEVLAELEEREIDWGVRSKPRHAMWERLCDHVELEGVAKIARRRLKARGDWRAD